MKDNNILKHFKMTLLTDWTVCDNEFGNKLTFSLIN